MMNHFCKYILIVVFINVIYIIENAISNNINIDNISIVQYNQDEEYLFLKFDIIWENSWRLDGVASPHNWDAAWIFAKFSIDNGPFRHVYISTDNNDHIAPKGGILNVGTTDIDSVNYGMGVFLYRNEENKTTENNPLPAYFQNVRLRWKYGEQGVDIDDPITLKIYAVEMVYVPRGYYYAGDGASIGTFRKLDDNEPVLISDFGTVIRQNSSVDRSDEVMDEGVYIKGDEGINSSGSDEVITNPDYPTGYEPFYVMKYSLTMGQYADFLNSLSSEQALNRWDSGMGISQTDGGYIAHNPYRGANNMSWSDVASYAAWAGLRPMTELEFEKAARGPLEPVPGEFAWGTSTIALPAYQLENSGAANERIVEGYSEEAGNAHYWRAIYSDSSWYSMPNGPIRVGIFAKESYEGPASPRVQSGAGYYGVMDLTGNLRERVITLGNANGRNFRGTHGDGNLTENGLYSVPSWPSTGGAGGTGLRGGDYRNNHGMLEISGRPFASYNSNNRQATYGFRGVRTAPDVD